VPPSTIISLRGSAGGGMALKYCFVDASNLNSVKEQARLEVIGSVESLMSERFRVILLASLVLGLCSP